MYSLVCLIGVILSLCAVCQKPSLGEQGFCTQILAPQQTPNPLHHRHGDRTEPLLRTNLIEETFDKSSMLDHLKVINLYLNDI